MLAGRVICQLWINDSAQWVINDPKVDSKKYFPFDRKNISNVATHPAGVPSWQNSFVSTQKLVLLSRLEIRN